MQGHANIGGIGMDQSGNEWVKIDGRHPLTEGPAADNARHAAADYRAGQAERPRGSLAGSRAHQLQGEPKRQPEADQIGDEFWEMGSRRSAATKLVRGLE